MSAPALTRRALLGAAAAAGACALPAVAVEGIPSSHPDAALLDFIARHAEAWDLCERTEAEASRIDALVRAVEPPKPEALRWRPGDFPRTSLGVSLSVHEGDGARWYGSKAAGWMRGRLASTWFPGLSPQLGPECEARRVEVLAAWDGWRAEVERVEDAMGLTAAEEACAAAGAAYWPVLQALEACRPRTLDGLRAKAKWVVAYAGKGAGNDDAAVAFACEVATFEVGS